MAKAVITISEKDVETIREVVADWRRHRGSPAARGPTHPPAEDQAPDVYIARTPAGGIPAMEPAGGSGTGTCGGTGTTATIADKPGSADCAIFQIIHGDAHCVPELWDSGGTAYTVYNLSTQAVAGDTYVIVARDKFGSWLVLNAASTAPMVRVRVIDYISPQETLVDCSTGTGTGVADDCGFVFHHVRIQTWDSACQRFDDGACVYLIEQKGMRLPQHEPYDAWLLGVAPSLLEGSISDPSEPPCTPTVGGALYMTDLKRPTYIVEVGAEVGKLCDDPTTSTGTGTAGVGGGGGVAPSNDENLIIYQGTVKLWDADLCAFIAFEDVLVANVDGCELDDLQKVTGVYNSMVPARRIPTVDTTGTAGCMPLYLTVDKTAGTVVSDVRCVGGVIKVYRLDSCNNSVFDHNAGCCTCVGTGSEQASDCGQEAVPLIYSFQLTSISNALCLNCTGWNLVHALGYAGSGCWFKTFDSPCPGMACVGFTLCCEGDYMVLDICLGRYRLLIADWNWFGSNDMLLFEDNSSPYCSGLPADIIVTAS